MEKSARCGSGAPPLGVLDARAALATVAMYPAPPLFFFVLRWASFKYTHTQKKTKLNGLHGGLLGDCVVFMVLLAGLSMAPLLRP